MNIPKVARWIPCWSVLLCVFAFGCQQKKSEPEVLLPIEDVITAAGNAASEAQRYRLLSELLEREDVEGEFRSDLDQLLRAVDRWANGRERYWEPGEQELAGEGGYLGGFFVLKVWPFDDGYPHQVDESSCINPISSAFQISMRPR